MDTPSDLHNSDDDYHPSKVHILVVDDDILTRKILATLLKRYSYNGLCFNYPSYPKCLFCISVSVVGSGSEAWDLLKEKKTKFDLVLTDVMMPAISGLTLLQMINEDEGLRDIPVICTCAIFLAHKY